MKKTGIKKETLLINDKFQDEVIFYLTKKEYKKLILSK